MCEKSGRMDRWRKGGVFFLMEIKGAHIWGSLRLLWGEMSRWVSEAHGQKCVLVCMCSWVVGVGVKEE